MFISQSNIHAMIILLLSQLWPITIGDQQQQKCPQDWMAFPNGSSPSSSPCFKIFLADPPVTMQESRQTCVDNAADFASVHSDEENAFLMATINALPSNNSSSANQTMAFYLGLFVARQFTGVPAKFLWSDGSPSDYFHGQKDSLADHLWADGHFLWPNLTGSKNDQVALGNCVVMVRGQPVWRDTRCDMLAQGFVCRKVPQTASPILPARLITMPALAALSLCFQCYVIWLIVTKSAQGMHNYRFYLCGSTFCLAEFGVLGQGLFQVLSVLFRHASVFVAKFILTMEHHQPRVHWWLTRPWVPYAEVVGVCFVATAFVVLSFPVLIDPEKLTLAGVSTFFHGEGQKLYSDALLAHRPVLVMNPLLMLKTFSILAAAFCIAYTVAILFAVRIVWFLRSNAGHFTKHTYQLQLQLIISLMVQLLLPFMFIGFPLLFLVVDAIFSMQSIGKTSAHIGILLFELYAMSNPLSIVMEYGTLEYFKNERKI